MLIASEIPVITGESPPSDYFHSGAKRMFANHHTDYNGPSRMKISAATTKVKKTEDTRKMPSTSQQQELQADTTERLPLKPLPARPFVVVPRPLPAAAIEFLTSKSNTEPRKIIPEMEFEDTAHGKKRKVVASRLPQESKRRAPSVEDEVELNVGKKCVKAKGKEKVKVQAIAPLAAPELSPTKGGPLSPLTVSSSSDEPLARAGTVQRAKRLRDGPVKPCPVKPRPVKRGSQQTQSRAHRMMYSEESEEGDNNVNEEPTDKATDGPHDHEDTSQDNMMDHQDSDGAASHHAPVQPQIPQPGPSSEVSHEAPHQPCLADSHSRDPHDPPQSLSKESIQNPPEPVQCTPRVPLSHNLPEQLHLESRELSHEPIIRTGGRHEPTEHGYDPHDIRDPLDTRNFHCPHDPIQTVMQSMHATPSIAEVVIFKTTSILQTSMIHASESVMILLQYIPVAIAPFPITCMPMKLKNVSGSLTTMTMWEGQGGIRIGKDHGGDTKTHATTA
ncbi:uncharacterized protein EDB91DRAFT_1256105 [Suillus paluster]|uniref:uncharacterized protein n=1 Tax=Suillus paluster TaxID=48578 RepID=UPI001B868E34|nr:uncharacterized protein EDB91DRAFT_1256105 [Suillus paluster]KAG1722377.1 hypothetical protein EDB91DRAFT_1256105 [Suillus paluster]